MSNGREGQPELDDRSAALGAPTSFPNPFIQAWVRSTTQRLPAVTGAGSPRARRSRLHARSSSRSRVTPCRTHDRDGPCPGPTGPETPPTVQRRPQQRPIGSAGPGGDAAQRDAGTIDNKRALQPLFAPIHGTATGTVAPTGRFGDASVDGHVLQLKPNHAVVLCQHERIQLLHQPGGEPHVPLVGAACGPNRSCRRCVHRSRGTPATATR